MADRVYHRRALDLVEACEIDWCRLFARRLTRDKTGLVRCEDCVRAEEGGAG
jgi:hypothetical protein